MWSANYYVRFLAFFCAKESVCVKKFQFRVLSILAEI